MVFKANKEHEKKEKALINKGDKSFIKHEMKEVAEAKKNAKKKGKK